MLAVLDEEIVRHRIAKRIAMEFEEGSVVNLGIGIPTLVSDYITNGTRIIFQTENGCVGAGSKPAVEDWRFIGAGGRCISPIDGASFISSEMSFGIIRGGHLDATVLGALEIDENANLANWMVPGKLVPGMGGAMDLVSGAKNVIIATTHTDKTGRGKIVKKCSLPLTGVGVVNTIVTEFCLMRFINGKLTLCEISPEVTVEDIKNSVEAEFIVSEVLCVMKGTEQE